MYVLLKSDFSHCRELPVSLFLYPLYCCQGKGRKIATVSPGDSKYTMNMNGLDSTKEKCSFPSTGAVADFGGWGDAELSSKHFSFFH